MKSGNQKNVATAVLPSGNANDHHTAHTSGDLLGSIRRGEIVSIELLSIEADINGKTWQRYAHSYIGFGLTSKVGRELTARKLNVFNEKWHTLYHMLKFRHVDLVANEKKRQYNNLIFATVPIMSKIVKLDPHAKRNDGKMERYETEYTSPWALVKMLLRASIKGVSHSERVSKYTLRTIKRSLVQLDGEVFTIDAHSDVTIRCEKNALRTIF